MVKTEELFPVAQAAERGLDRRRFLGLAGCAAILAAAGEWLGRRLEADGAVPAVRLEEEASLGVGEARAIAAGGREALVVRLAGDEIVAFDRRCPHLGCPVIWSEPNARFECPCHRAAFDARTGRVLFGPPRRGLARMEIDRRS